MNGYSDAAYVCLFSTTTVKSCRADFHVSVCFQGHILHVGSTMLVLLPSLHGVS